MKELMKPGLLAAPLWAAQAGLYELANSKVLLAVDPAGNLAELTNRQTGHRYVTGTAGPIWRMYYRIGTPVDERSTCRSNRPCKRLKSARRILRW
jgi:hypothetical protein